MAEEMSVRSREPNGDIWSYLSTPSRARPYKMWKNALAILMTMIGTSILDMLSDGITWSDGTPIGAFPPSVATLASSQNLIVCILLLMLFASVPIVLVGSIVTVALRERPLRTAFSSDGRFSWRLFLVGLVGIAFSVPFAVFSAIMGGNDLAWLVTGLAKAPIANVIVFLTAICASAALEEVVFRGYVRQSLYEAMLRLQGRAGRTEETFSLVVASILSALLFSIWHSDGCFLESFLSRMSTGLLFSVLVDCTGGLEVAMAMHAMYDLPLFIQGMIFMQTEPMEPDAMMTLYLVQATMELLMVIFGVVLSRLIYGKNLRTRNMAEGAGSAGNDRRQPRDDVPSHRSSRTRALIAMGLSLMLIFSLTSRLFSFGSPFSAEAVDSTEGAVKNASSENQAIYLMGALTSAKKSYSSGEHVMLSHYDKDMTFISSDIGIVLAVPGDAIPDQAGALGNDEYLIGYGSMPDGDYENECVAKANFSFASVEGSDGEGDYWLVSDRVIARLWPDFALL